MGPEDLALRKTVRKVGVVIDLLDHSRVILGELEHPALGDIERLIERLREEQAELQRRNLK